LIIRTAELKDLDAITAMEKACFPIAEAATRESFENRLKRFADHFWVMEEDGILVSCINGMVTDEEVLRDEMFADATLHKEAGEWQMIFGVLTLPKYQGKGYASILMKKVIEDCERQRRKGIVLTCKEELIHFYAKFGYKDAGSSKSTHGGAKWYEMRLEF